MGKVYGNLIVALERTKTSKSELGTHLGIAPNTLKARFDSEGDWTLREMNLTKELLASKGCIESISELFERN